MKALITIDGTERTIDTQGKQCVVVARMIAEPGDDQAPTVVVKRTDTEAVAHREWHRLADVNEAEWGDNDPDEVRAHEPIVLRLGLMPGTLDVRLGSLDVRPYEVLSAAEQLVDLDRQARQVYEQLQWMADRADRSLATARDDFTEYMNDSGQALARALRWHGRHVLRAEAVVAEWARVRNDATGWAQMHPDDGEAACVWAWVRSYHDRVSSMVDDHLSGMGGGSEQGPFAWAFVEAAREALVEFTGARVVVASLLAAREAVTIEHQEVHA